MYHRSGPRQGVLHQSPVVQDDVWMPLLVRIVLWIVGIWLIVCLGAWLLQRRFQYFPDRSAVRPPTGPSWEGLQAVTLQAADGATNGDRVVDSRDIQAILSAAKFATGIAGDWTEGDFNGGAPM